MSFTTGSQGGEYKHILSIPELNSSVWLCDSGGLTGGVDTSFNEGSEYGIKTLNNGMNKGHNNLQPYVTTYFWKRTS